MVSCQPASACVRRVCRSEGSAGPVDALERRRNIATERHDVTERLHCVAHLRQHTGGPAAQLTVVEPQAVDTRPRQLGPELATAIQDLLNDLGAGIAEIGNCSVGRRLQRPPHVIRSISIDPGLENDLHVDSSSRSMCTNSERGCTAVSQAA